MDREKVIQAVETAFELWINEYTGCSWFKENEVRQAKEDALSLLTERGERMMPEENKNHMNDPVNHPSHYTQGNIECIDFITDKKLNFCRGNAVKYIVRAGLKDPTKEIEDLEKAIFYINREIQDLRQHSNT